MQEIHFWQRAPQSARRFDPLNIRIMLRGNDQTSGEFRSTCPLCDQLDDRNTAGHCFSNTKTGRTERSLIAECPLGKRMLLTVAQVVFWVSLVKPLIGEPFVKLC